MNLHREVSPRDWVASLGRGPFEPDDGRAAVSCRRWATLLVILGVTFRVVQYLWDRSPWLDERGLGGIIERWSFAALTGPLGGEQVAPLGFLFVEKAVGLVFGYSTYALRFFPLICGVAAVFLMRSVADRCLPTRAVPVALALFAVSDDLNYYASELKPYSGDVAAALAVLLASSQLEGDRPSRRRVAGATAVGATAPWFSYPALIATAGVGLALLTESAWRRDRKLGLVRLVVVGLWGLSGLLAFGAARGQLATGTGLWAFWEVAFPPRPLGFVSGAWWATRRVAYLFINPLSFPGPFGTEPIAFVSAVLDLRVRPGSPAWSISEWTGPIAAMALCATGVVAMARRRPEWLARLTFPVGFALLAAFLRKYPFHGRLVLFLTPSLHVLIAEGAERVRVLAGRRRWPFLLLLAAALLFPTIDALQRLAWSRDRSGLNPVGDYRKVHRLF